MDGQMGPPRHPHDSNESLVGQPEWVIVAELNQEMLRDEAFLDGRSDDSSEDPTFAIAGPAELFTPDAPPSGVVVWCRVLGPVEVAGWRSEPSRYVVTELCCYLAHHRNRPLSGESIRAALWPDGSREAGAKSLRNYVSLLRGSLGDDLFPKSDKGAGYRVTDGVTSDWATFGSYTAAAQEAERGDDAERATHLRCRALGLVRGTPFCGVPSGSFEWAWTELLVSEIERTVAATALAVSSQARRWDPELAAWAVSQGLRAVPLDEELWDAAAATASQRGANALLQVLRDREAVLGSSNWHGSVRYRGRSREVNGRDPGVGQ